MARTPAEVEASLQGSILQVDDTVDVVSGPIPDVFIIPQAAEISLMEQQTDDLARRYSVDYVASLGRDDMVLFGANHSLRMGQGTGATGSITYFRYARPAAGQSFPVPLGALVATEDGLLNFQVTSNNAVMDGTNADVYYNATRRRYEITVDIRALGLGPDYAVPANRIRVMATPVNGFDGIAQLTRTRGGDVAQSNQEFAELLRSRLEGSALGSLAGLESLLRAYARGEIKDVSIVFNTDPLNFRRRTRRPSCDIWIIGNREGEFTETFTADSFSSAEFTLTKQPAKAVLNVSLNGNNVPFEFVSDSDDTTRGSVRAKVKVRLSLVPPVGSVVVVRYIYNQLIEVLQEYADTRSSTTQEPIIRFRRTPRLFGTEALIREADAVTVNVEAAVTILSSFDEAAAQNATVNAILASVSTESFEAQILPEDTRTLVARTAVGVSAVNILRFQRPDRPSLLVDAIEFRPYEYPVISTENISVSVRRA